MLPAYRKALRKLYTAEVNKLLVELRDYRKRINRFLMANENSPSLRARQDAALAEAALSSARMSGEEISPARLLELADQSADPTSNRESEAMGVRFAMSTVEDSYRFIHISTGAISQLHRDFYRYTEDAECCRWADARTPVYYAGELDKMASRRLGGQLITKQALLRDACNNYRHAVASREFDPIVEASMFALDVLNIRPFKDGNDRLARLLFQMMAYQLGYMAPRYEPLTLRIEELGPKYHETAALCPRVVPEGASEYDAETDYEPFVLMMLEALLDCCRSFEARFDLDSIIIDAAEEEPEEEAAEPEAEKEQKKSSNDVSLEERLAMRAAIQATAREILSQPIAPAFAGAQPGSGRIVQRHPAGTPAEAPAAPAQQPAGAQSNGEAPRQADAATPEAAAAPQPPAEPQAAAQSAPAAEYARQTASVPADNQTDPEDAEAEEAHAQGGSNEDIIRAYFDNLKGDAAKKDVVAACPSMSAKTVERMIQKLLAEGYILKLGAARATTYRKT